MEKRKHVYKHVTEWLLENQPDKKLIHGSAVWPQVKFVRDKLPWVLAISYHEFVGMSKDIMVVGEHVSRSITLPVFQMKWLDYSFVMRNNFHDWKVSVSWVHEWQSLVNIDFADLVVGGKEEPISSVYCEGFREEDVYGSIERAKQELDEDRFHRGFTVSVPSNHHLWTFFWLIEKYVRDKYSVIKRPDK
jgi:hypothetical protein